MKRIILPFLLVAALVFFGCGSDPEVVEDDTQSVAVDDETQEDTTETTDTTQDDTEETPDGPTAGSMMDEDLTDLIAQVEAMLVKASEVGAGDFFPEEMNSAAETLEEAVALAETNPPEAKTSLEGLLTQGEQLYRDSLNLLAQQYRDNLQRLEDKLIGLEAPQFAPAAYQNTVRMRSRLEAIFAEEDVAAAYEQYRDTYEVMSNLSDALANDIAWIEILIRDTEAYMADAEEAEAFIYAEEELNLANDSYLAGLEFFEGYDLQDAEQALLLAKYYARKAAYSGDFNRRVSQTDELMYEVMEAIEEASNLTIVDDAGNIQNPRPWEGESALQTTPLAELEPEQEDEEIPASNIKTDEVPIDGTDGVQGETEDEDYLATAQELWQRGVEARNAGDLELADQYFLQAKIFVEAYESNAVTQVYTVQWREVDTDCLWRIAGYDDIYGNPYLWPKIWRRNKRQIENPDLIFPGQVLVIPPQ